MTEAGEIAAWLREQAEADRGKARAASKAKATGDAWEAGDGGDGWTQAGTPVHGPGGGLLAFAIGDYAAEQIARHDPRTEVARAESVLAVLDDYAATLAVKEGAEAKLGAGEDPGPNAGYLDALRELAVYESVVWRLACGYRHREGWKELWGSA